MQYLRKKRQSGALLTQEGYRNKGDDEDEKEERKLDFKGREICMKKRIKRKEGNR